MNTIKIGGTAFPRCLVEVTAHKTMLPELAGMRTLTISSGAATMHTYLTSDEMRQLGKALMREADLMDAEHREFA